jgi:hypothetical protein
VLKWRSSTSTEPVGHKNGINDVGMVSLCRFSKNARPFVPDHPAKTSLSASMRDLMSGTAFLVAMLVVVRLAWTVLWYSAADANLFLMNRSIRLAAPGFKWRIPERSQGGIVQGKPAKRRISNLLR